jgi:hypothetical protein
MRRTLLGMEHDLPSRHWLELSDPEAARMVTEPSSRRYLEPFIAKECSTSQLAREVGVDISSALYRVKQFVRLGLITEARLERRRGRAVRYYRSVAEGFYVPFSATQHATTETLAPNTFAQLQITLNRSIAQAWTEAAGEPRALGVHIFRMPGGGVSENITTLPDKDNPHRFFERLLEPDAPAVWDTWGTRKLSHENAKRLQRELSEVFSRYPPEDNKGNKSYMVRLAIAPLFEEN